MPPRFKRGDHRVQCDRSGAIVNASDCRMTWDGLFVLKELWHPKHPQDEVTVVTERRPSVIRSPSPDRFLEVGDVTADDL